MKRTIITFAENSPNALYVQREELTENGWEIRTIGLAAAVLCNPPLEMSNLEFVTAPPFTFVNLWTIKTFPKDDHDSTDWL